MALPAKLFSPFNKKAGAQRPPFVISSLHISFYSYLALRTCIASLTLFTPSTSRAS